MKNLQQSSQAGVNIRNDHYPPSIDFLALCLACEIKHERLLVHILLRERFELCS